MSFVDGQLSPEAHLLSDVPSLAEYTVYCLASSCIIHPPQHIRLTLRSPCCSSRPDPDLPSALREDYIIRITSAAPSARHRDHNSATSQKSRDQTTRRCVGLRKSLTNKTASTGSVTTAPTHKHMRNCTVRAKIGRACGARAKGSRVACAPPTHVETSGFAIDQ